MVETAGGGFYGSLTLQGDATLAAACAAGVGHDEVQDRFVIEAASGVLAVADGLSGHAGAALAAELATAAVRSVAAHATVGPAAVLLEAAFAAAEASINERARGGPEWRDMGVAIVVAVVRDGELTVANAGDARAYLLRGAMLTRLTTDHSGAGERLHAGLIDEDAARTHPARQPLTRVVGGNKRPLAPSVQHHALAPGDVVLLCSDGVWAALPPLRLAALLGHSTCSARRAARALARAAQAAGSADDVCAVVCRPPIRGESAGGEC